ncbi:unnamed protein product [Effrenium voratum]|uniref:RING-type domain-containing protein n=1 Tax=Effrenium voratum TaxID=2562239 RepID=A0AA36JQJ9_9DINO|nr:unnamed protein product [Effrenium voratum]CAJ1447955.1 unnamed protein product [Effrenium voratum]
MSPTDLKNHKQETAQRGELLNQCALQDEEFAVERGLLASWVRGAVLARNLVIVMRVTIPGCWGPPRIVLLRARPTASEATKWHKAALVDLRGGRLSCVGWGRYELRNRGGELVAAFRPELSSESLALSAMSLDRLREIERHCWGPWRRSKAPVLGQVCEARWGPIPACPDEVLQEASRIARVKAAQTCRVLHPGMDADRAACIDTLCTQRCLPRPACHALLLRPACRDGNLRPFVPTTLAGEQCNLEELRESAHQIAALAPARPESGWVCAVCLATDAEAETEGTVKGGLAWRKLPCGHVFHKNCVLPWIRGGKPCPLGRCAVPAAARAGRKEMCFTQPKNAWKQLPHNVVARDIQLPAQAQRKTGAPGVPPHLRVQGSSLRPNHAFFDGAVIERLAAKGAISAVSTPISRHFLTFDL